MMGFRKNRFGFTTQLDENATNKYPMVWKLVIQPHLKIIHPVATDDNGITFYKFCSDCKSTIEISMYFFNGLNMNDDFSIDSKKIFWVYNIFQLI